jgi:hypothetical protein
METRVIKLNENRDLNVKSSYSFSSRFNMKREMLSSNEVNEDILNNDNLKSEVSFESLVDFIIKYGIKVEENESENYKQFMFSSHICIEFYGVQYYIPLYNYIKKERIVFENLLSKNQTF